ncbi:ASCH domain-containing protein [Paenibacillus sp. IITD108]|uniref:ASCH domain-containing protein n=1 Tax=Paenibacillus sp. IITD108 TaxID=3116649 RepID=UPI002F40217B
MRAITLIQPWATLIALGEKRFETRSRRTHIRGPLAIHAGKKIDREACEREPIKSTLAKHGYTADNLPTGVVVAVAELKDSFVIHPDYIGGAVMLHSETRKTHFSTLNKEFEFGWFEQGRYAWELANVQQLPEQIPAKGQQGFWFFDGLEVRE